MATNKRALAICDICGFQYPHRVMRMNSYGMLVCPEDWEGAYDLKNSPLNKSPNVKDNIAIRMWTDDITPIADQDYIDLDWKYEYDEYVKKDNSKFKNTSETEMQLVDVEINYDKILDRTEENKKFINDTNDWKSIYDSKKY